MYQFSDSESSDSEDGIRYKTDSTRNKSKVTEKDETYTSSRYNSKHIDKYSRHTSPSFERKLYRTSSSSSRNRDRDKRRTSRSRSTDRQRYRRSPPNSPRNESSSKIRDRQRRDRSTSRMRDRPRSRSRERSNAARQTKEEIRKEYRRKHKHEHKKHKRDRKEDNEKSNEKYSEKSGEKLSEHDSERLNDRDSDLEIIEDSKNHRECCSVTSNDTNSFGPALPLQLKTLNKSSEELDDLKNVVPKSERRSETEVGAGSNMNEVLGPALPPHLSNKNKGITSTSLGPALTPHLSKKNEDISESILKRSEDDIAIGPDLPHDDLGAEKEKDLSTGPALPPHLVKKKEESLEPASIGPALPPHLIKKKDDVSETPEETFQIGPTLPSHLREKLASETEVQTLENSDDDDVYGPLPAGMATNSQAHLALEERALQMKIDSLNSESDTKQGREEWMLELPSVKAAGLGLGPRQFRKNAAPDMSDRSSWTETPEQKAKEIQEKADVKVDLKKEAEALAIQKHDQEQEEMIKKNKKKKKEKSLLVQHQEKLDKKKKKEKDSNERRPFSRDIDLKVNRFDDAQKKAILKKAQLLDDRFSRGQSKFL